MIFQQPNFFGFLEPAPELAAAANEAGALRGRARRSGLARRARGARELRLRDSRSARARAPATTSRYGGPHYGFLASKAEYTRRLPGRIIGETTDLERRARLRADAADARAAHPPREGDLEHHDQPDAARARRARPPLVARAAGAARGGGDVHGARRVREGAARARRSRFPDRPTFKEFAVRVGRPGARGDPRRARARRASRLRARPRLRGHGRRAARRGDGEAHSRGHRPAGRGARRRCGA